MQFERGTGSINPIVSETQQQRFRIKNRKKRLVIILNNKFSLRLSKIEKKNRRLYYFAKKMFHGVVIYERKMFIRLVTDENQI